MHILMYKKVGQKIKTLKSSTQHICSSALLSPPFATHVEDSFCLQCTLQTEYHPAVSVRVNTAWVSHTVIR
jgi:hypothetical protein